MDRRECLHVMTAATLAANGFLPILASAREKRVRTRSKKDVSHGLTNIYTEPPAIEPITGYLPKFTPADKGTMRKAFVAKYALVSCLGSAAKSRNNVGGSLDIAFSGSTCTTTEIRKGTSQNIVKTELKCDGPLNTASSWTLDSSVEGIEEVHFVEEGSWDGKTMLVRSKSWTQKHSTSHPLIGRWALLPLLASGKIKSKPLRFDMLDDSSLRPDQVLRYEGEVEIPLASGVAVLDSYAQTGQGIIPTHYLVDKKGRVQLITMSNVNWALSDLR
jgi:hypothetical protein